MQFCNTALDEEIWLLVSRLKSKMPSFTLGIASKRSRSSIQNILSEFSKSKQQVYTITSDNVKSILKTSIWTKIPITSWMATAKMRSWWKTSEFFSILTIWCVDDFLKLAFRDFVVLLIVARLRKIVKTLRTLKYNLFYTFKNQIIFEERLKAYIYTRSSRCNLQHFPVNMQ